MCCGVTFQLCSALYVNLSVLRVSDLSIVLCVVVSNVSGVLCVVCVVSLKRQELCA